MGTQNLPKDQDLHSLAEISTAQALILSYFLPIFVLQFDYDKRKINTENTCFLIAF